MKSQEKIRRIGVIGGSGLYKWEGIEIIDEVSLDTPFGQPSDAFIIAKFLGKEIVFLPRHGKNHTISPTNINYRANIYGMKMLGVENLISVSACGSLKEELKPLDFVIPTQFVDRTNHSRKFTFFDGPIVAHISFAQPICLPLGEVLYDAAVKAKVKVHLGGTYLNMEGPQFSTLAESNLYRSWGMDIIGMTNMMEARLAREAEICYSSLAAITDYDCWHQEEVSIEMVISNLKKNIENAKLILEKIIAGIDQKKPCLCNQALKYALVSNLKAVPEEEKHKVALLISKYNQEG